MSVPLQSVPDNQETPTRLDGRDRVAEAEREAAEIVARARREAEAITADAHSRSGAAPNPLAALGSNAEEIIGQVRKLIAKQRQLQAEREEMIAEVESLRSERDELVQRLTDAVDRMEELARIADMAKSGQQPPPARPPQSPPPPPRPSQSEDTSLAARLRQAEQSNNGAGEDSSLAARLERAEREEQTRIGAEAQRRDDFEPEKVMPKVVSADGRSFYDRHSAKLPRLEGDGGRSVLSAMGGMRPEPDPKSRKGRRRNKK